MTSIGTGPFFAAWTFFMSFSHHHRSLATRNSSRACSFAIFFTKPSFLLFFSNSASKVLLKNQYFCLKNKTYFLSSVNMKLVEISKHVCTVLQERLRDKLIQSIEE